MGRPAFRNLVLLSEIVDWLNCLIQLNLLIKSIF
ncbi:hypothetical protein BN8_03025 [Fibrisoma limi BUZ 3]|uniref:Uncharacterized protein n=1 Tax=Fibrisoma limi BUZ 3 TaxID=1185876 RepID=I2GJ18_9BACT|nr:hypothetical protein BN8_03025 [Fibrisoma limi BUZ 3]